MCAGGTGRAVRECACTRCACPSVLKDTSERRRRSRCPGDVTARPSDNRPVPEPSADTSGGSGGSGERGDGCTRAGPGEWESDSRSADLADAGLLAGPREFARLPWRCPCALLHPGPWRTGPAGAKEEAEAGAGDSAGGAAERRRRQPTSSRRRRRLAPGRVTALAAPAGASRQAASRVTPSFSPRAASSRSEPQGKRAQRVVKKRLLFISEHRGSLFSPHSRAPSGVRKMSQGRAAAERFAPPGWSGLCTPQKTAEGRSMGTLTPAGSCISLAAVPRGPCCRDASRDLPRPFSTSGRGRRQGSSELGADQGCTASLARSPAPPAPPRRSWSVRAPQARTPRKPQPRPRPGPAARRPPQP